MTISPLLLLLLAATPDDVQTLRTASLAAADWPMWRGPEGNGFAAEATPPLQWDEAGKESQNIRWKVPIEGHGTASPIVLGDRVFVLTAVDTGRVDPALPKPEDQPKRVFGITHPNTAYRFVVLCLDRATGQTRWRAVATQRVPHEGHHNDASFASASPVTDGERVYAWFGSAGLFCYDLDGRLLWKRDLGPAKVGASLGEGTSPAVRDGRVVIVRDHAGQSSIVTLDAATGKTIWERDRDEPNAWATPRIVSHGGRTQIITAASNFVRSYDLATGELLWKCGGLTGNVTPVPIGFDDTVICMSGYQGAKMLAIRLDAEGDVTGTDAVVWSSDRDASYVPSSVLAGGLLYLLRSNQSALIAVDAATGRDVIGRTRLGDIGNVYASPVAAAGRVYIPGRSGRTVVLAASDRYKVLATNRIDERVDASPALSGDALFLRSLKSLYCIAEDGVPQ